MLPYTQHPLYPKYKTRLFNDYYSNVKGGQYSSYSCKIGDNGVNGPITKDNCMMQWDTSNAGISRCTLAKSNVCRKRQNRSPKRGKMNWLKVRSAQKIGVFHTSPKPTSSKALSPKPTSSKPISPKPTSSKPISPKPTSSKPKCVEQLGKKYLIRDSPPYPANECCGELMEGKYGQMYKSVPNKKGICRWNKV